MSVQLRINVPFSPARISAPSASAPIPAIPLQASTNSRQAATFGPIEHKQPRKAAGEIPNPFINGAKA